MRLDDRARNRQTNAHPLAFRGDEWLEQLLVYLGRNSRSSIGDVDLDHPAVRRRRYDEFAVLGLLHRFDGVAHEVEQNLLNLHLVREHKLALRVEGKAHVHTAVLGADEGKRARLFDELLYVLNPPLAFAARNEITQPANDLPRPQRLLGRLFHGGPQHGRTFAGILLEQPARASQVIGNGRKRLVELVRERRCHLAHRRQPRHVHEFGLQFLQPRFALLAFGKIADEPGKEALIARAHLPDAEFKGKCRMILALADDDAANADYLALSGAQIAVEIAIMPFPIWRRHQYLDVFAHYFRGAVAEKALRCGAERLNGAPLVDDDHRVGNGIEDGFDVGLARQCRLGARRRIETRAAQQLATPRGADADGGEDEGIDNVPRQHRPKLGHEIYPPNKPRMVARMPGPQPPSAEATRIAGTKKM